MNTTSAQATQNVHVFAQEARDDPQPLTAHLQSDQAVAQNARQTFATA